ncbi:hypothetical protein BVX98_04110 [bacterium F11]|nr:hypothetical protein BVX98_04110 [bacterium F11]
MSDYYRGLPGWKEFKSVMNRFLVCVGDMMAVSGAYLLAYYIRFYFDPVVTFFPVTKGFPPLSDYLKAGPLVLLVWIISLMQLGTYRRINYPALDEFIRLFRVSFIGAMLSMSAMFLYRESSYSRLVFILGGGLSWFFVFFHREILKITYLFWVRKNRRPQRVLILGNGYLSKTLKNILEKEGDRAVLSMSDKNLDKIRSTITRSRIREVLVANPDFSHVNVISLATFCEERKVKFRLLPDILELRMGEVLIDESLGVPTFQLKPVSLHGSAFFMKRLMDVVLTSIFLGIFFIPLAFIAILIKMESDGPIFYQHPRMGYGSKPFLFLKFRTMVRNADDLLEKLKNLSDRSGPVFKMKNDPRVTPLGRFLRRYSIDEIPQFLNVLRGEMSLVGPRPQVLWEASNYNDWARKRLNVLPGITGLWQVSGRAELTFEEMIELDIFYIEHWSPGLDIKIMLRTFPAVMIGKGAY